MAALPIVMPPSLADFCRRNSIQKLSLFGSVLTERFRPESDVDVLVEFIPGLVPTLLDLARLERELGGLLGRRVDLRTKAELSPYFRDAVLASALPQYERT